MGDPVKTFNLFIAASPLHYLCARRIADLFCRGESNHLFYNREFLKSVVSPEGWDSVSYLPWPRHYPERGPFGRIRRTRKNLDMVIQRCSGAERILLHAPVIDTEATNYLINALRKEVPAGDFFVRLIPDGTLNIQRHPLGSVKELGQYVKKARRLIYPSLDYYAFRGCRTGADAQIVDRIYTLPGFSVEYDPAKVVELPSLVPAEVSGSAILESGTALVIGQPLTGHGHLVMEDMQVITQEIAGFLKAQGIEKIYYKKHPRDPIRELYHDSYQVLETEEPLETHLARHPYEVLISVRSTALVTGKLLIGDQCRVISFGLNRFRWASGKERVKLLGLYGALGIEMVEC